MQNEGMQDEGRTFGVVEERRSSSTSGTACSSQSLGELIRETLAEESIEVFPERGSDALSTTAEHGNATEEEADGRIHVQCSLVPAGVCLEEIVVDVDASIGQVKARLKATSAWGRHNLKDISWIVIGSGASAERFAFEEDYVKIMNTLVAKTTQFPRDGKLHLEVSLLRSAPQAVLA